ncbi:MAG: radical SAM protein [Verrucomicrobiota bacterium]|nr:radical SAM protein [Verrucomicrobiota bacterium]
MTTVSLCETFTSIQGESSWVGLSCFFIRLAGCNLRCRYCDTACAYADGRPVAVRELVAQAGASPAPLVEITGGEPLLQAGFRELSLGLRDLAGKRVLVETNGSMDISLAPERVIVIMDVKCPGSGQDRAMDLRNVERLRPCDEVKFVLTDERDYDWARRFVEEHRLTSRCNAVFFSPVFGVLDPKRLAEWIVRDGLSARLQAQFHKVLGVP